MACAALATVPPAPSRASLPAVALVSITPRLPTVQRVGAAPVSAAPPAASMVPVTMAGFCVSVIPFAVLPPSVPDCVNAISVLPAVSVAANSAVTKPPVISRSSGVVPPSDSVPWAKPAIVSATPCNPIASPRAKPPKAGAATAVAAPETVQAAPASNCTVPKFAKLEPKPAMVPLPGASSIVAAVVLPPFTLPMKTAPGSTTRRTKDAA